MSELNLNGLACEVFNELADCLEKGSPQLTVGITTFGNEHGIGEVIKGAELASERYPFVNVVLIGDGQDSGLPREAARDEAEARKKMKNLLDEGSIDAAVTMHYDFPLGTATVGRVIAPGSGREFFLASTTGLSDAQRMTAIVMNAVGGIATAKAFGKDSPTVGILNIDGAVQVQRALNDLRTKGYRFTWADSLRQDGGPLMRGNDVLSGTPDVLVCDTLSGNLLVKILSALTTGGRIEISGCGYGLGVGENFAQNIGIVSRASGAPVIANALGYAAQAVRNNLSKRVQAEYLQAKQYGLTAILERFKLSEKSNEDIKAPEQTVPATEEIRGIDVLDIEEAVRGVWKNGIFAAMGMGCTGPAIMVAPQDKEKVKEILIQNGYL
ncbi:glycine/sarcosine/betaine reductase complex component C subunit alpha [Desulfosporosinus sp. SB140]|uniref:glycine/sarcosine/betaine reductase complex component C subunit alpha n=1 Tax=Desulfosporosinus paludis TaxID=3115649 RepID=UPI00388FA2ED